MHAHDSNEQNTDQADGLRQQRNPRPVKVITVTGGKGGGFATSVTADGAGHVRYARLSPGVYEFTFKRPDGTAKTSALAEPSTWEMAFGSRLADI